MQRTLAVSVFILFMAGTLFFHSFYAFLNPLAPAHPETKVVRIQPGMGLRQVTQVLTGEGIIQDPRHFMLLAWWKGLGKKIQWGDFELSTGLPPATVLDYLATGKTMLKRITIPEGFTLRQITERLALENVVSGADFLKAAEDPKWLAELGVAGKTLEGYLFPDTYFFHRGMSVRLIQKRLVKRFQEVYRRSREEAPGGLPLGLDKNEIVILASIVEKESGLTSERPLIASVFYNRLKKGMALQSDPTVIYGLKDFNGDLTRKHLDTPTPYNTYTRSGLPPGPIANPGEEALRAVLYPARSDYYYFVSKNDGSHYFSRTLQEHHRAVVRYQLSGRPGPSAKDQKTRR